MSRSRLALFSITSLLAAGPLLGCDDDDAQPLDADAGGDTADAAVGVDPDTAPAASVDRFSAAAGHLMVRSPDNGLPAAGAAIDFDQAPFITNGLGPNGGMVSYYNFDVQPTAPANIYVLFHDGADAPVEGQLNLVDVVPGDGGYNDFWLVNRVTVPDDFVANSITSVTALEEAGFEISATTTIVNCPVVPVGSTATQRLGGGDAGLSRGWYRDQVVSYLNFSEAAITAVGGQVPTSPIYVAFNVNPDQEGGGPPSGFVSEEGSAQTHNVVATTPGTPGYSPLWSVNVYDNADFANVTDLPTVLAANVLVEGVATVNCPIVVAAE